MDKMTLEQFGASVKQKYPQYAGFTDTEIGNLTVQKYPEYADRIATQTANNEDGYLVTTAKEIGGAIKDTYTGAKEVVQQGAEQIQAGAGQDGALAEGIAVTGRTALGAIGKVAEGVGGVLNAFVPDWLNQVVQKGSDAFVDIGAQIREQDPNLASKIDTLKADVDNSRIAQTLIQKTQENPDLLPVLNDAINTILMGVGFGKVAPKGAEILSTAKETALKTTGAVKEAVGTATQFAQETASKAKAKVVEATKPAPITPVEAVKQVAQGKTTDVKSFVKALESVDTSKVQTFADLESVFSENIPKLSKQVDKALELDKKAYKPKELLTETKTTGGKTVKTDYVSTALKNLVEVYTKIGDKTKALNIKELITKFKTKGLTLKEVNDIARMYGIEFKNKAFSKTGDALTSINAQAFENTRSGLKATSRSGKGGKNAQAIDAKISAIYDAQTLVKKNVEAVNKLQQRIQNRGLAEKVGALLAKYGDILTGGSIRGFVGGLLPRGAGYKILNALDIEAALRKNLDTIERALKSKTDAELIKILNGK